MGWNGPPPERDNMKIDPLRWLRRQEPTSPPPPKTTTPKPQEPARAASKSKEDYNFWVAGALLLDDSYHTRTDCGGGDCSCGGGE